jgi:hypothetical protein
VVWDDQSKWTSKVALVPFASAVNVGPYFTKITGLSDRPDNDGASNKNIHYPDSCLDANGNVASNCSNSKGQQTYDKVGYIAKYATCVVEREGNGLSIFSGLLTLGQFTDEAPGSLLGAYLPAWNVARSKDSDSSEQMLSTCAPGAAIVPLTKDRGKLKASVDALQAGSPTAGQLGTAFAWYMLSPNWRTVWPAESQPTPYGTAKVKKITLLMTDCEYNTLQGNQYSDGSSEATKALDNAKTLCTNMKRKLSSSDPNIEIYTVGFKLTTSASKAMLKSCATDAAHYYETSTGDALKQAFRDIALKISKLRLTN